MAVTPNYGWPVPVATDYVKDGWEAISDLGNAIDTTVAGLGSGLTLVKSQTIGTAVSSVTVTGAFSATYDAYKIIISTGVASADSYGKLQLGASTASYDSAFAGTQPSNGATNNANLSNGSFFQCGYTATNYLSLNIDLINPFLAKYTLLHGIWLNPTIFFAGGGVHKVASSYTDFTFSPTSGTLTGGLIRVYGYQLS